MAVAERRLRAMGAQWCVTVTAPHPEPLLDTATALAADLEARWSRFRPGSELSRVNAAAGRPERVSAETRDVVRRAVTAWHATGGRFDPTVGAAVRSLGYDRSFESVDRSAPPGPPRPAPGCAAIEVDDDAGTVQLPAHTSLDLGGIGKGFAADLLAAALLDRGATAACVDAGGDVRVAGEPPPGGWWVAVEDPLAPGRELLRLALGGGAVATSSTLTRRWADGRHHLVDPGTGRPATTGVVAATVVAGECWWAEVLAKAAVVAGGPAPVAAAGAEGLAVHADGMLAITAGLRRYTEAVA